MLVIAEKINATRKSVAKAMAERDAAFVKNLIHVQDAAGCDYLDLNVGRGGIDSRQAMDDMRWLLDLALDATETPFCVDSSDPKVMNAAAEHLSGRRKWLLNSVNAERESLEKMLPIAAGHKVPLIALAMGGTAVPKEPVARMEACETIYQKAIDLQIPPDQIYFDPLVLPAGADASAPDVAVKTIALIKERFPESKTSVGLSNVSYGLPVRSLVNQAFAVVCVFAGADMAIVDPTDRQMRRIILAAEALSGKDEFCMAYLQAYRQGRLSDEEGK